MDTEKIPYSFAYVPLCISDITFIYNTVHSVIILPTVGLPAGFFLHNFEKIKVKSDTERRTRENVGTMWNWWHHQNKIADQRTKHTNLK
jgi:hypothetical protein